MLKLLKINTLGWGRRLGVFGGVAGSRWRQRRLLILCYHGLSLKDEHKWRDFFITPAFFRSRLETLARLQYRALPLRDAVRMLREGSLPFKSVAITFDDGFHDFHQIGFPLLREFGFPATVYQTTYYCDYPFPIFNLILSYLFWRSPGHRLDGAAYGLEGKFDLTRDEECRRAVAAFLDATDRQNCTPAQKNELATRVAGDLGVDYAEIMRLRLLQLMTAREVSEIVAGGMDVQLHSHRHMTPVDEGLFVREIRENRQWLTAAGGSDLVHYCYPSGVFRHEFLTWLRAEHIQTAATCNYGLATRETEPLLLPRVLDSMNVPEVVFEGWLSGVYSLLPNRRL